MGQKRMVGLDVFETSGVDHPAHLHEGFAVMKSGNPNTARALLSALGKDKSMTQKKSATSTATAKSLAEITAAGDAALAILTGEGVAKAIDSKLQAALDSLAETWQALRAYAESADEGTPSTDPAAPADPAADPALAAAAAGTPGDELMKSASPELAAFMKSQSEALAKAQSTADDAVAKAEAETAKRLDNEAIAKSRDDLPNLALDHGTVAPALRRLEQMAPDVHKAVTELLVASNAQLDGAALTKELGSTGSGSATDAWGKIEELAKAKTEADPALTIQKARTIVFTENPDLQKQYQKEVAAR